MNTLVCVSLLITCVRSSEVPLSRRRCITYDDTAQGSEVIEPSVPTELGFTEMVCSKDSDYCYTLWDYDANNTISILKQGCWGTSESENTRTCVTPCVANPRKSPKPNDSSKPPQPYFCCCDENLCNEHVTVSQEPFEYDDEILELEEPSSSKHHVAIGLLVLFGSILFGGLIMILGFRYWKNNLLRKKQGKSDVEDHPDDDDSICEGKPILLDGMGENTCLLTQEPGIVDGMQLLVLLARGKFASVYEGNIPSLSDQTFALKCFGKDQKEFFENERFVFNYLGKHCNHLNIIKYHGWQEFTVGPTTHLILVLDKITPGSLRDFLTSITVSSRDEEDQCVLKPDDVLKICGGIASGLSYLHGENRDEIVIAHRDLTSKNILLDASTLTPKITDFGLSLVTRGSKYYAGGREFKAEHSSLSEAGTLRYMAPELLEGAVNLKDCENALKQADVYAMALILWEVANTCPGVRLTNVEDTRVSALLFPITHELPYESVAKDNLHIDALSRVVVQYRQRPGFRKWRDSVITRALRDTLVESWDPEPDARLTALCVVERIHDIRSINVVKSHVPSEFSNNKPDRIVSLLLNNAVQVALESPSSGYFGIDDVDSPWTGRNVCLQRNLLSTTDTSNSITSTNDGGGVVLEHAGNLNYYSSYVVGGSSGGTSYTSSSVTAGLQGNVTEVSNLSEDISQRPGGGILPSTRCPPSQSVERAPPTIPFLQNLHN